MPSKAPWTGGSSPGADRPSVDGNFAFAHAISQPEISFPFDSDSHAPTVNSFTFDPDLQSYVSNNPDLSQNNSRTDCFLIEQTFEIAGDYFEPLALDTFYDSAQYAPDYAGSLSIGEAILITESNPRDAGNGLVRWTRTYCRIPGVNFNVGGVFSRNAYESDCFSFPSIGATTFYAPVFNLDGVFPIPSVGQFSLSDGRLATTAEVTVRVQRDYFLVAEGSFSPDFADPVSPFFIFQKFKVYGTNIVGGDPAPNIWQEMDIVLDATEVDPDAWQDITGTSASAPYTTTTPPKNFDAVTGEYGYLDAVFNNWEIVVRQSCIRPWRGNIYERTTYFASAQ